MVLTGLDYAILGVLAVSAVIGVVRGLIREILALVSWILSAWLAVKYAQPVADWLSPYLQSSQIQYIVALASLFVVCLLTLSMIAMILVKLLTMVGVAGTDRTLGGLFGLVRGVGIALVLVFVIRLTPATSESWFVNSVLAPYFEPMYEYLDNRDFLEPLNVLPGELSPGGQARS